MNELECSSAWSFEKDKVENLAWYDSVFTPEECDQIINYAKQIDLIKAETADKEFGKNWRKSKIRFIQPVQDTKWIYQKITDIVSQINNQYFGFDLWGIAEGLQFTEYNAPDDCYKYHIDKGWNDVIRKMSFTIQLSDPLSYEGGDFQFLLEENVDNSTKNISKRGTIFVFPSYVLHRVTTVTSGTRHSLVGWVTGPSFK